MNDDLLIVCAALKVNNRIICGFGHYDPIMRQQILASEGNNFWHTAEQGFIDNQGNFLNRKEAYQIAKRNNQIKYRGIYRGDELFSEDLY